jgi:YD repeat-containing protein
VVLRPLQIEFFRNLLGSVTKFAYDSGNRLTSITLPNGDVLVQNTYDSSSRVISQTNARGYTTTLAYNTPAEGKTTITDPLEQMTVHTYDSSMRLTGITDALGHTSSYTYDANDNVASITDGRKNISNFAYDSLGTFCCLLGVLLG